MAELVDALDSKSSSARSAGSIPARGTTLRSASFGWQAIDAFIAADDAEAKARVSTFLESLGLRPFDVGGLHMGQTLEALGLMMIGLAKNGAGTWDFAMNINVG